MTMTSRYFKFYHFFQSACDLATLEVDQRSPLQIILHLLRWQIRGEYMITPLLKGDYFTFQNSFKLDI
jgi:hypothetical protein